MLPNLQHQLISGLALLALDLDNPDHISFFYANTPGKSQHYAEGIKESVVQHINLENLCLYKGDASACDFWAAF